MKHRKTKATGDVDSDGNSVVLSDVEKEGDGGIGDESMISNRAVDEKPEVVEEAKEEARAAEAEVAVVAPKKKRSRKSA